MWYWVSGFLCIHNVPESIFFSATGTHSLPNIVTDCFGYCLWLARSVDYLALKIKELLVLPFASLQQAYVTSCYLRRCVAWLVALPIYCTAVFYASFAYINAFLVCLSVLSLSLSLSFSHTLVCQTGSMH